MRLRAPVLMVIALILFAVPVLADSVNTIYDVTGEITLQGRSGASENISNISFEADWVPSVATPGVYLLAFVPGTVSFSSSGPLSPMTAAISPSQTSPPGGHNYIGFFGGVGGLDEIDVADQLQIGGYANASNLLTPVFAAGLYQCQSPACLANFGSPFSGSSTITSSFDVEIATPESSTLLFLAVGLAAVGVFIIRRTHESI
jgi:hypothetical protein